MSQYAVDGAQKHRQSLVVERNDDGRREIVTGVVPNAETRLGPRVNHISLERGSLALRHVDIVAVVRWTVRVQENRTLQFAKSVGSHPIEQLRLPAIYRIAEGGFVVTPVENHH